MRKRAEGDSPQVEQATWARLRHLRLAIGGDWPGGQHTAAEREYQRIDALKLSPARKTAELRAWLIERCPAATVDAEIERMVQVSRRYGGGSQPVKRLRVIEPEDDAA